MRFKIGNPSFPAYDFYLLAVTPEVETAVNRLGPVKMISGTYDWPHVFGGYRNWTDSLNSLWWPRTASQFSTCVLLIDDARNDLITNSMLAQRAATPAGENRPPSLVLSCLLSPPEGQRPGDAFPPTGVAPVTVETVFVEWQMYPLAPVNLTSLTSDERFRGLWLLPLVDIRYFERNVAFHNGDGSSSSSGNACEAYPLVCAGDSDYPSWMPPLRAYPQDLTAPMYYAPISGMGVQPTITSAMDKLTAVDLQAEMNNLRVVCRDVRSKYNVTSPLPPHDKFTGVVADYPENYAMGQTNSYHLDAMAIFGSTGMRLAGGISTTSTLPDFTAKKLQFLCEVNSSDCFYSITLQANTNFPYTINDFSEDVDGPNTSEQQTVPAVLLGIKIQDRTPTDNEKKALLDAAKQWFLIYRWWRYDQTYMRYPGIVPVIPNGHAATIRWDFQSTNFQTTYVALEGVEASSPDSRKYAAKRLPFYARIDGEGLVDDALQGVYAWTELIDDNGTLAEANNSRRGYVAGVNGYYATLNPARDEANKVAVPVGLTVWLRPGKVFIDMITGECFDHYLFNTTDLMQVLRLKVPTEINDRGHYRVIIKTWEASLNRFINSKEAWAVILRDEDA